MKQEMKEIITLCVNITLCLIGGLIGGLTSAKVTSANLGSIKILIGVIIGGLITEIIICSIKIVFFPPKMFEGIRSCYQIVNNKLYYNINCNGDVKSHFITDVDEDNDKYRIMNSPSSYFPAVMVNGELKIFLLKNTMQSEGNYNFYIAKEVDIDEISLEKCVAVLDDCCFTISLNKEFRPDKQYLKTTIKIIEYGISILVKEQVALDIPQKAGYKRNLNDKSHVYDSWREAYEEAKRLMLKE